MIKKVCNKQYVKTIIFEQGQYDSEKKNYFYFSKNWWLDEPGLWSVCAFVLRNDLFRGSPHLWILQKESNCVLK